MAQKVISTPGAEIKFATPSALFSNTGNQLTPLQANPRCVDDGRDEYSDAEENSSDSDYSESDLSNGLTYEEQREVNVKRNYERLVEMNLVKEKKSRDISGGDIEGADNDNQSASSVKNHYGMIFPTNYNGLPIAKYQTSQDIQSTTTVQNLDSKLGEIRKQYPGRDAQIFAIASLLQSAVEQTARHEKLDEVFVPPPVFVQGAAGTAKTSIVRDIVNAFTELNSKMNVSDPRPFVGSAYINCATISPSSIFTVLESAFSQIVKSFEPQKQELDTKRKRKLRLRPSRVSAAKRSKAHAGLKVTSMEGKEFNGNISEEIEDRFEKSKHEGKLTPLDISAKTNGTGKRVRESNLGDSKASNTLAKGPVRTQQELNDAYGESRVRSYDAPIAFGRSIRRFCGDSLVAIDHKGKECAILVLDHAEKLLTLAPKRTIARTQSNYLAQLLLLPKELRLNLMIICISTSSLLLHSRVNNAVPPPKSESCGTIEEAIHPLLIRFPAYTNKHSFKEILRTRLHLSLSIGDNVWPTKEWTQHDPQQETNRQAFVSSFLDTVIQSLLGTTRDVRDMFRMAQCLWPKYTIPIEQGNIKETLKIVRNRLKKGGEAGDTPSQDLLRRELLQYLDEKIIRHTAVWIDSCLFVINDQKESKTDMSYASKCLLLAGFICQRNKAEKDRNLFTNQKSGRKNSKIGHLVGEGHAENAAFADTTWDQQRLKMLRPRCFSLERMLSVFVNIIGVVQAGENLIHPEIDGNDADLGQIVRSMGTSVFFESLAQMREMGLLREIPGTRVIGRDEKTSLHANDLSSAMYCCDLDEYEAMELAFSIKLPLTDYLLH